MKTVLVNVSAIFFFLVPCPIISVVVTAQNPDNSTNTIGNNNQYPSARFSPSMAVIIVILIAALFFMGFFSIYIRHCSDSAEASGRARRGTSVRGRRAEAVRGLDASVIESFPTFTYAEVKDHKIGKGALECAVCLNEFEEEETLRLLPKCDHVFHPECVDAWLASHVTCPVCRANLVPQAGDEAVPEIPESTVETEANGGSVRRTGSSVSVIVQIDDDHNESQTTPRAQSQGKDNSGFDFRNRSIKLPRMMSFSRFRSHSTGHDSVVRPGENLDRFTLRLPADVRREVMHRAALNRTRSCAVTLPREGSSRRGYRNCGEGSSRAGRFFRRMDTLNRDAKSDRWVFFTRVFSMKSPRAAAETSGEGSKDGGSVGGRAAVKLPSFKCLEPSVGDSDEVRLISGEPARSSPV